MAGFHKASAGFRWVKPAASLKLEAAGYRVNQCLVWFPLGKTGGLIEA